MISWDCRLDSSVIQCGWGDVVVLCSTGVIIEGYPGAASRRCRGCTPCAVITTTRVDGGAGDLPSKASRAESWTPVLNASEEPVLHQITCNQFRDLHVSTSAPPMV